MASEKSLYRKIQETLETCKAVHVSSLQELREAIESRQHHVFQTLQYDANKDAYKPGISSRVIRQTVQMCLLLGLIERDGTLTAAGRDALRKNRFDDVIGIAILAFLKEQGVKTPTLNQTIAKGLESRPPVLPTAAELWRAVDNKVPRGRFTRLLTLLSHCGHARASQKKVYLQIG